MGPALGYRSFVGKIGFCLWVLGLAAGCTTGAAAQEQAATQDESITTLHVYTNLVQIPTLVLGPDREQLKAPIAEKRFSVSVDSGRWFRATHVRREGDDPISLAILLDMRGGEGDFAPNLADVIADLPPSLLNAKDHVSIYALGCDLMQSLNDAPADAAQMKLGIDKALTFWDTQKKDLTCVQQDHLWDALAYVAGRLYQLPGRRVILALTQGKDSGSKHTWNEARRYLQDTGVAVFGISHDFPLAREKNRSFFSTRIIGTYEDPFSYVCELSGGLVFRVEIQALAATTKTVATMLRDRYIVEFPRPSNATSGPHEMRVKIDRGDTDFIVATGITVPLPDPAVLADPTTVSVGPKDTPELGDRHIMSKPQ